MIPPDQHRIGGVPWCLDRAWPRDGGDVPLLLSRVDRAGVRHQVVGRWYPDPGDAIRDRRRNVGTRSGDDPRLLLHPDGADRKLPALAPLVRDGSTLLAHRPGKRAVIRTPAGDFVKFVRVGRAEQLARRHHQLADALGGTASVPAVTSCRDDRVVLAAMPGTSPLLRDPRHLEGDLHRVGSMLGQLARVPRDDLPVHDAIAEAAVARGWAERAMAAGRLPRADIEPVVRPLLEQPATPLRPAHRDLHDGQLLVTDDQLSVLDPDTLCLAEPALDLANLLVHLDLRVDQGLLEPTSTTRARAAILDGAAPTGTTVARLPAYDRATRLRLAAVYAFRPRWQRLARRWFVQVVANTHGHREAS